MKNSKLNEGDLIELNQEFIVIAIPSDAVKLQISAVIFHNNELHEVYREMGMEDIREAIQEAKTGYVPSDGIFSLTELGEKQLKSLEDRYKGGEET